MLVFRIDCTTCNPLCQFSFDQAQETRLAQDDKIPFPLEYKVHTLHQLDSAGASLHAVRLITKSVSRITPNRMLAHSKR
jgi:hypothetical protein